MSFLISVFKPLAYLSLPVILLRSIAASSPTVRYYTRVGTYLGTMTVVAACSAFVAAGMSLIGRQYDTNYIVARIFYFLTRKALDLEIQVEGEHHLADGVPAVLMSNHQSMLDVFVIGRLMPHRTSMLSKKSLQYTPLGPFMSLSGAIFIDRGNNSRALRSLAVAADLMRSLRVSIWMFPEGTRHSAEANTMLPLKKGGFHLAIQAGLPIVPIVTENYWRLYRSGVFESGSFKVRVLPPIPTTGLTAADVSSLATRVRDQMLDALREISVVPAGPALPSTTTTPPPALKDTPRDTYSPPPPYAQAQETEGDESPRSDKFLLSQIIPPPAHGRVVPVAPEFGSSASLASTSTAAHSESWSRASENGGETEEDEGMILVGRPGA